jgi:quercetin dioxygenase-like cupin family protein
MTSYTDDVGVRLGSAIRARRHVRGMTLVEVAASSGLSHPFLSQLERGLARPSMRSLTAIASTLGTTAQALMAASELPAVPDTEPVSVVRRAADEVTLVDSPGGSVRPLVRGERSMLPVEFNGAPREFHEYYRHDGEEFVYVVLGLIEIEVEGELHSAGAGDSVYYPGGYRHRWRSLSDEEVKLVVVQQNLPPIRTRMLSGVADASRVSGDETPG